MAAERAPAADQARSLDPAVVRAIVDAGFARHFTPERWGGNAGTFAELIAAVAAVGEACTSAAWCASLAAFGARQAAFLPLEAQREVWAKGPDTFLVGAVVPAGRAEPVPGGWRLNGTWPYVSGVAFADFMMIAAQVPAGDGADVWYFAVPPEAYQVQDRWFTAGMRGTGSNTVILENVFVPQHRGVDRAALMAGQPVGTAAPCHATSLLAITALPFAGPLLGAGRAAVRAAAGQLARKRDDPAVQIGLARSAGEVDAAELLLGRVADVLDRGVVPAPLAARGGRDIVLAAELITTAVNRLFRLLGTSGYSQDHPMERIWRDVNTASSHSGLRPDRSAAMYAKLAFAEADSGDPA
jgi:alkylation response protein AidB-like acyl-CoA dehydrogenase